MPRKQLMLIFGFVFLDLLGYSLILPLLPYYADAFGATVTMVGLLGTSNAGLGSWPEARADRTAEMS